MNQLIARCINNDGNSRPQSNQANKMDGAIRILLLLSLGVMRASCTTVGDLVTLRSLEEGGFLQPANGTAHSVTVITEVNGTRHIERIETVVVPSNFRQIIHNPDNDMCHIDSLEEATRTKRACTTWDSSVCRVEDEAGVTYFTISVKLRECTSGPDTKLLRFYSKFPGTFVMRLTNRRGSYVIVMKTYKGNQVLNFPINVHMSYDTKVFLYVRKEDSSESSSCPCSSSSSSSSSCEHDLFDSSFGFESLELDNVLYNYQGGSSCGDFRLLKKGNSYAILEQREPFKSQMYTRVGSCILFPSDSDANREAGRRDKKK
ncbi:uncharacterized protein LOC132193833 [Neocloeon triangulifer]|uniref:uncharacterized protein LOC132193833 n=1 Tax=Neocloeon triangulifer TaxID=2078957 RepID=UPI00286EC089|nr:uncharacterized protein LOC132193833 [Neocloeon triangulifer]